MVNLLIKYVVCIPAILLLLGVTNEMKKIDNS